MKESENAEKTAKWNSALGMTYALLCATFSVMNGFFVKKVTSIKPIEMLFWRTTVQIILIWPVCMYRQYTGAVNSDIFGPRSLQPNFVKWLLTRGCVGFTACALLFEAYGRLPIGDATALSSNIVWTSLIGFVVLREKIHWVDICAIPINIFGVVLLAQPSFLFSASSVIYTREMQLGLAAALTAAFGIASSSIVLRHIAKSVHFTVLSFWFSLISMLSSGIYLSVTGGFNMPCRDQLWAVFLCGPNSLLVQSCFTLALKYEKAARVSMINTSQIVWGFLVQVWLLNEPTNQYSVVGACLVFVSALVVGMRKLLAN